MQFLEYSGCLKSGELFSVCLSWGRSGGGESGGQELLAPAATHHLLLTPHSEPTVPIS